MRVCSTVENRNVDRMKLEKSRETGGRERKIEKKREQSRKEKREESREKR